MEDRIIYTLQNMSTMSKMNLAFLGYVQSRMEVLKYRTSFIVYGGPGASAWKGNHTDCRCDIITYDTISQLIADYSRNGCAVRLDCGNLTLQEEIPFDVFGKVSIELASNGSNQIEVSSSNVYDYMHEKFPAYAIAASELNLDYADRDYIAIVRNPFNLVPECPKAKTEIVLHHPCIQCGVEKWGECVLKNQMNLYNYSRNSMFLDCNLINTNIHFPTASEIETYISEGYRKFQPYAYGFTLKQLELYLVDLVKPEFREEVRNYVILNSMEG